MDDSRSFITAMKSFPMNIEVIQDFTYNAANHQYLKIGNCIQMNQSMILLPEKMMQPRLADPRVGWFTMRVNMIMVVRS
jgi:hypothetical protein